MAILFCLNAETGDGRITVAGFLRHDQIAA
jgi:hypothetical protein